jgi:DNA-binding NarL/FixJ family response regulator
MNEMSVSSSPVLRVLLADDSSAIRRIVTELFAANPAQWTICGECRDGRDTIQKAAELRPDVVLLDLSLPVLSGLEVARILGRDTPSATLVLMSAQEQSVLERLAVVAKAPFSVSKSLIAERLIPVMEEIFAQKTTGREAA